MQLAGGRLITSGSRLLSITEIIRTNLLPFTMEIAEEFGYEIELKNYNEERLNNNNIINQYMSTNIITTGDGNLINTGNKAKIDAEITINKGNKEDLAKHLQENGISKEDKSELLEIIDKEKPNLENKTFGNKVNEWTKK